MRIIPLLLLMGCSSTGFYYDRYGLGESKLLNYENESKDRPLSDCYPGFKCVVFFSSEFYKMKSEFEKMQLQLEVCQDND